MAINKKTSKNKKVTIKKNTKGSVFSSTYSKIAILFVVVAVIVGGYLVYNSYAASYNYVISPSQMYGGIPQALSGKAPHERTFTQTTSSIGGDIYLTQVRNFYLCVNARNIYGVSIPMTVNWKNKGSTITNTRYITSGTYYMYLNRSNTSASSHRVWVNGPTPIGVRQFIFANSTAC